MKTHPNDKLFQKDIDKPYRLEQPEKCDKTCVKFSTCNFPESCRVRIKEKQAKRSENKRA
jgi:hypothetical protein